MEVPGTNRLGVEDPEDLVLLTVVLAHAPVGNLEIGFVAGQDVMSITLLVGCNASGAVLQESRALLYDAARK